jgi:7-carboxy-7-deazaguanine synthase (Cx14CxxC type)
VAYAVKELFLTLQGEGANAGRPAVFLRFAGCNLWSGREDARARGTGSCARWCDTDFVGTDGPGGGSFTTATALATAVASTWTGRASATPPLVVCTGGEPLLQLDAELVAALRAAGFEVAIETNGTLPVLSGVDWVCVSPKAGASLVVREGSELKLVYPQPGIDPSELEGLGFTHFFLQPLDDDARAENTAACVAYCIDHPRWRLSLQTHKLIGIR